MGGDPAGTVWLRGAWHFADGADPQRALCGVSLDGGRKKTKGVPALPLKLCPSCCSISRATAREERIREAALRELARRRGAPYVFPPVKGEH